jgi:hypothetical protein
VKEVPASCNLLWKNKNEAIGCPKGHIKLAFCRSCTLITNLAIQPEKNQYGHLYDNSLFYSKHFQDFAKELTETLIQRYNLYNKRVVEVGCGKVDFLSLFSEFGHNKGLKFNPACAQDRDSHRKGDYLVGSIRDSCSTLKSDLQVDFVFSYHELEHVNSPENFLNFLRKMVGENSRTCFFFAVPNALKAFEEGDYTDIIYEHVSYFTVPSLYSLFSFCGYGVSKIEEFKNESFDSICVDAAPRRDMLWDFKLNSKSAFAQIEDCVRKFAIKSRNNIRRQGERLDQLLDEGKRVVVWGAGARGVTFLNIFEDHRIEYAVDINPRKQGMYIPGTGQRIVRPEFLLNYQPDIIILANSAYKKEIKQLMVNLGIEAKLVLI